MTKYELVDKLMKEYANLDIEIKGLECLIKTEGIKGMFYDDMPKSPNLNTSSPVENTLNILDKLKNDKMILEIKKESIENMFKLLDKLEYDIMKFKYMNNMTNYQISKMLYVHENTVSKKSKIIVDKFYKYGTRYMLF